MIPMGIFLQASEIPSSILAFEALLTLLVKNLLTSASVAHYWPLMCA